MNKEKNDNLIITLVLILCSVICTVLVKVIDVAAIGPNGTKVGFSHINQSFHELTGVNMIWYTITDWLGLVAIAVMLAFAALGLVQLVKAKFRIRQVDCEIIALGGLYVILALIYVIFEKFVINYRPIIMPGCTEPEASFPSSHTMLVIVVMGSAMMLLNKYIGNTGLRTALKILCVLMILVVVGGRLISGVHWLSDIVIGVIYSITLLSAFNDVLSIMKSE